MKPQTSLPSPVSPDRSRTRTDLPEGSPTGVVYSYTFAPSVSSAVDGKDQETLVLVKLNGGPMLMGSVSGASRQEVRIGARVRMLIPLEESGERLNGRHVFEPLRLPGARPQRPVRVLESTAA